MAERVQVQGLGDAVPGIQPTIQRAGQYSVGQRRASAVGRNKLMDLADALSQVNPMLQQYTQVADIEAEQFEDELSRKSPEEIQAMLQKTEGEFDKQVRKGAISWLTSPINQKRKIEALGKVASRDLMVEINKRLTNPLADDPEGGADIVNKVRDEYIQNNPGLAGSVIAQQGLQKAINPQIQPLVTNFEVRQNAKAKGETAHGVMSSFYENVRGGYQGGELNLESKNELATSWSSLNSYSAEEQRKIFGETLIALSRDGLGVQADALLDWATTNLNFGASKMSAADLGMFDTMIDKASEDAEEEEEEKEKEAIQSIYYTTSRDIAVIRSGKEVTYDGVSYKSEVEYLNAVKEKTFKEDPEYGGRIIETLRDLEKPDPNLEKDLSNTLIRETPSIRVFERNLAGELEASLVADYADITTDQRTRDILLNAQVEYSSDYNNKSLELVTSGLNETERKAELETYAKERYSFYIENTANKFNILKDKIDKEDKIEVEANKVLNSSYEESTKAPTSNDLFYFGKVAATPEGLRNVRVDLAREAIKVTLNPTAEPKEKQKSFMYLMEEGSETLTVLSERIKPGAIKEKGRKGIAPNPNYNRTNWRYSGIKPTPDEYYTSKEREQYTQQYLLIEGITGGFVAALAGEEPVTQLGFRFKPETLQDKTKTVRMLTVPSIEAAREIDKDEDMPQEVKDVATKIGVTNIVNFVKDQRELHKRLNLIK